MKKILEFQSKDSLEESWNFICPSGESYSLRSWIFP